MDIVGGKEGNGLVRLDGWNMGLENAKITCSRPGRFRPPNKSSIWRSKTMAPKDLGNECIQHRQIQYKYILSPTCTWSKPPAMQKLLAP